MLCFSNIPCSSFYPLLISMALSACAVAYVMGLERSLAATQLRFPFDRPENVYGGHFASNVCVCVCATSKMAIADRYTEISR